MEVDPWTAGPFLRTPPPAPLVRVRFLQTVAACTDLACVTLAASWGGAAGGAWGALTAASLDADLRRGLGVLDVFFGHGFCLRDAALVLWGADHPAMEGWDRFLTEIEGASRERLAALVGLGLAMRLDAHGIVPSGPDTAAVLSGDPEARRAALVRLMDGGDGVAPGELRADALALAGDLPALRERVLTTLRGFGTLCLPAAGDPVWGRLRAAALRVGAGALPPDPVAAFPLVTGRAVPAEDREALAACREVLFCCCGHLGEQCAGLGGRPLCAGRILRGAGRGPASLLTPFAAVRSTRLPRVARLPTWASSARPSAPIPSAM